jgi:hypothetical protein
MITLTIVLSILLVLSIGVIINLLLKIEKLEDVTSESDSFYNELRAVISLSSSKLQEIDEKGAFRSDDEIGWFFTSLLEIQSDIEKYLDNSYDKRINKK